jgi:hypothetical protein
MEKIDFPISKSIKFSHFKKKLIKYFLGLRIGLFGIRVTQKGQKPLSQI